VIHQALLFGRAATLTVEEALAAARRGIASEGVVLSPAEVAASAAVVLLVAWLALRVAGELRRRRWSERHLARLSDAGLHPSELALFERVVRAAEPGALADLVRRRGAFDAASADLVARHEPRAGRQALLSELLVLRRRLPFDLPRDDAPRFERGAPVQLYVALGDQARRVRAVVLATREHGLQLAVEERDLSPRLDAALAVGEAATLVVARGRRLEEARVRVRGRVAGRSLQLLVDRPATLSPSRVRLAWAGADERVAVELVERWSEELVGDAVPTVDARVVASCSDGLLLEFGAIRPQPNESIRVVDGAQSGLYRGFATLDASGRGGAVFVIRRSHAA